MFYKIKVLSAVLASVAMVGAGHAGPLADLGVDAEQRLAAGDFAGALAAAEDIRAQVWDAGSDIGLRDTLLVTEPAVGYGLYNPRADNKFKPGDPVYVYAEPFGFGYGSGGDGLYSIGFAVDLRVISSTGEVIFEARDVASLDQPTRYKIREFQANITYTLARIPPGVYQLETTLRDKNSAKTATFQTEVEFTE